MTDDLPTPRSISRTGYQVHVWCKACRPARDADLAALIAAGRGDVPLIELRFRCSNCGSRLTDFVCTSADAITVQPWRAGAPDQPTTSI